jgi:hypothetical protein
MPLNVENKTYVAVEDESAIQQTPRLRHNRSSGFKYFFFGLAIILVVSSSVFLIYIFLLNQQRTSPQPHVIVPEITVDTTMATQIAPVIQPSVSSVLPRAGEGKIEGDYTIYIAAYTTEPPAVDDVTRWNDAGFVGAVVPTKRHYRVSLGKFSSVSKARTFAEEWTDAFEYGYWIGKFQ